MEESIYKIYIRLINATNSKYFRHLYKNSTVYKKSQMLILVSTFRGRILKMYYGFADINYE